MFTVITDRGVYRLATADAGQAAAVIWHQRPNETILGIDGPREYVRGDGTVLRHLHLDEWVKGQ